jgi:hypothetical protein
MPMNESLFEQLLYEEEGQSLDFKRDQYPFSGASDEQKSELLKDILAFANAWKRGSAFILIGVDEIKGQRSHPVGVSNHLDDASLQQFVNSKTNQPVDFHYQAFNYQGLQIGVIEVPVQRRPVYLTKPFGRLAKSVVYVRRSSSTAEADPVEIARMGAADSLQPIHSEPLLKLEMADLTTRQRLGLSLNLDSLHLFPRVNPRVLKPRQDPFGFHINVGANPSYYEEFVEYLAQTTLLNPIGFVIENQSGVTAAEVEAQIRIPAVQGLHLQDHEPPKPSKSLYSSAFPGLGHVLARTPQPKVSRYHDHFEVTIPFGRILPKSTVWSDGYVYVGAESPVVVEAIVTLFAENLSSPLEYRLELTINGNTKPMDAKAVIDLLAELGM